MIGIIYGQNITNLRVFSARSLKLTVDGNLVAFEYDLDQILDHFKLTRKQFPVFISLMGNYFVDKDWLKSFYHKVFTPSNDPNKEDSFFMSIAEYLKDFPCINEMEVRKLSRQILGHDFSSGLSINSDSLCTSYNYYCAPEEFDWLVNLSDESHMDVNHNNVAGCLHHEDGASSLNKSDTYSDDELCVRNGDHRRVRFKGIEHLATKHECNNLQKTSLAETLIKVFRDNHVNCTISPVLYTLFTERKIYFPVNLESSKCNEFIKSAEIFKPLRTRCYTLLFTLMNITNYERLFVEEIYFNTETGKKDSVKVKFDKHPDLDFNLEKMWCRTCTSYQQRLSLFVTSLEIFKSGEPLMASIAIQYQIPCLIVRYLLKNAKILKSNDIKAFVCTFVTSGQYLNTNEEKMRNLYIECFDTRAIFLAKLFMEGLESLSLLNDICGSPFVSGNFCARGYFFGKLFQSNYLKADKFDISKLCKHDISVANRMYKAITEDYEQYLVDYNVRGKLINVVHKYSDEKQNYPGHGRGRSLCKKIYFKRLNEDLTDYNKKNHFTSLAVPQQKSKANCLNGLRDSDEDLSLTRLEIDDNEDVFLNSLQFDSDNIETTKENKKIEENSKIEKTEIQYNSIEETKHYTIEEEKRLNDYLLSLFKFDHKSLPAKYVKSPRFKKLTNEDIIQIFRANGAHPGLIPEPSFTVGKTDEQLMLEYKESLKNSKNDQTKK